MAFPVSRPYQMLCRLLCPRSQVLSSSSFVGAIREYQFDRLALQELLVPVE